MIVSINILLTMIDCLHILWSF